MNKLAILAVAGLAAAASAGPLSTGPGGGSASMGNVVDINDYATVSYTHNRGTGNTIVTITFNTDVESWDALSDPSNVVWDLNIGSGATATMHGIGWDTTQRANGASWLSEMTAYFDDTIAPDLSGLFLTPGVADSFPGTGSYSSGGILDLSDNAIPDIVLPNGHLRLEFFDSFDDINDSVDGVWLEGSSFTLDMTLVPAPGALALLGFGGLATTRRRR